mgnify:CR=1 FL=1
MVIDEDHVQKKTKDNVIRKRKNPRRPAPFRLLDAYSNPPIFLGFAVLKTILNLTYSIKGELGMPTVKGEKFPYTRAGMKAAAKARKKPGNPDEIKTKADMMAENISSTIKNMGGGY